MASKFVVIHENLLKIKEGINKLSETVKKTLGPAGKNILIDRGNKPPLSTRDGVTVARSINFKDKLMNFGAQAVKEAASLTNNIAGDGTSTATVLSQSIYMEGLKYISSGFNPIVIRRAIESSVLKVVSMLDEMAHKIKDLKQIEHVATISANNDEKLGNIIAEAIDRVGEKGGVLVENSNTHETHLTFQEGLVLERGLKDTSPYFLTDVGRRVAELDNCKIMIIDDRIHSAEQLLKPLEYIVKSNVPLLMCVREIEDSVLGFLVTNKIKRGLRIAVIRSPGSYNNLDLAEDLAEAVGAKIFNPDWCSLDSFQPDFLGGAGKVVVGMSETKIVGAAGNVQARVDKLTAQLDSVGKEKEKFFIQDRINKLTNSIATLHVAGESDTEIQDTKLRIEDSVNATKRAMEDGILPGGGKALLEVTRSLEKSDDLGDKILRAALIEPARAILRNTGENAEQILGKIMEHPRSEWGYNAATSEYGNLYDMGVIDPLTVVKTALLKSSSVASMLLTTGACVVKEEEKK